MSQSYYIASCVFTSKYPDYHGQNIVVQDCWRAKDRTEEQNAAGKFIPHTKEEQTALMQDYCKRFHGEKVVSYCHYCLEGLNLGGADASHLASLLFEHDAWREQKS